MKQNFLHALGFLICITSVAQNNDVDFEHPHEHIHPLFEIGVSTTTVYLLDENEITVGFHTHFTTNISHHLPFITGMAYEYILDEHKHHSLGLVLGWNPFHEFTFSLSPGVATNAGNFIFTAHAEISYAFEIGKIHLGPALEYAYSKNDSHISLGLHLGFPVNKRNR